MTLDFKKNQAQVIGVCYRTFKVGNLHLLLGMDISIFSSEPTWNEEYGNQLTGLVFGFPSLASLFIMEFGRRGTGTGTGTGMGMGGHCMGLRDIICW